MSIRNMDADLAANKLNELFHLHRYEDCVLFLNRLSHSTIRLVISQISIDMYLSRLPYTIEIFEAMYAKIFIIDPDNFPTRSLQPERLIDKMVAYFSLLSDQSGLEPIDGARLLDSFENVIRVISYVQPNLYSRLLYFKYAIDKGLLRFENDLALYNTHLKIQAVENLKSDSSNRKSLHSSPTTDALSINYSVNGTLSKKSSKVKANALASALLISRASNMQTCESLRDEIVRTMGNCDKALARLNEFIMQLKSQKIFKDVQFILNQHQQHQMHQSRLEQEKLEQEKLANTEAPNQEAENNNNKTKEPKDKTSNKKDKSKDKSKTVKKRSESVNVGVNKMNEIDEKELVVAGSTTICQDFIQNRLYLNKAMMNSVDQYLETVRLHQTLADLCEKIDLDKEILLVFTHLKQEEKYLSSLEPLQPLFRRYSLGFERCIQIWRRKCSADSLLVFNDRFNSSSQIAGANQLTQFDQLYICNPEDSANINRMHSSYSSSAAFAAKMPSKAYEFLQQEQEQSQLINTVSAAAADVAMSSPGLKRSSTDIFNKYSNVVDNCLTHSMSRNQKFRASNSPNGQQVAAETAKAGYYKTNSIKTVMYDRLKTSMGDLESEANGSYEKLGFQSEPDKSSDSNQDYENEIRRLTAELSQAKKTIDKLKTNENELKQKLQEKINEQLNDSIPASDKSENCQLDMALSDKKYTSDLLQQFNHLNKLYRLKAYHALDSVKEIKTMQEFKLKLLFSVIILAYRYCKFYIKDLKRKVKGLLQISDRYSVISTLSRSIAPPSIVIDDSDNSPEELKKKKRNSDKLESSNLMIENALNKYFQVVAISKAFDLNKINEEVKEQLWNTLYDYPLKECVELNNYINEAVKICWALLNHQPLIKLGFSDLKFDQHKHERSEFSNIDNDQINQFIWPSLIDSSNNTCLSKGLVIT